MQRRVLFSTTRIHTQNIYRSLSRNNNILSQTIHSQQRSYTIANRNQNTSIQFEYGAAAFPLVRQQNVFYADRTRYIPHIEDVGRVLLFLRPRRMGKSLLISMLEHYYDVRFKRQFKKLFGGLTIGKSPTKDHNKYLVLKLDFSNLDTSNVDEFRNTLNDHINQTINTFLYRYNKYLDKTITINSNNAIDSFESLCASVMESNNKVRHFFVTVC
jgi:hypothetical protein